MDASATRSHTLTLDGVHSMTIVSRVWDSKPNGDDLENNKLCSLTTRQLNVNPYIDTTDTLDLIRLN